MWAQRVISFQTPCHVLQKLADGQVLRTDRFAFAAFQTGGRLSSGRGVDGAVIIICVPVVITLLGVHNGEQIRNGDVLGTAIRAVAAGRTRDEVLAAENLLHVPDGCQPVSSSVKVYLFFSHHYLHYTSTVINYQPF